MIRMVKCTISSESFETQSLHPVFEKYYGAHHIPGTSTSIVIRHGNRQLTLWRGLVNGSWLLTWGLPTRKIVIRLEWESVMVLPEPSRTMSMICHWLQIVSEKLLSKIWTSEKLWHCMVMEQIHASLLIPLILLLQNSLLYIESLLQLAIIGISWCSLIARMLRSYFVDM